MKFVTLNEALIERRSSKRAIHYFMKRCHSKVHELPQNCCYLSNNEEWVEDHIIIYKDLEAGVANNSLILTRV